MVWNLGDRRRDAYEYLSFVPLQCLLKIWEGGYDSLWLIGRPTVLLERGGYGEKWLMIPASGHHILQDFRSLLTCLAFLIKETKEENLVKSLELAYERLSAFIERQNREWKRTTGGR